MNKLIEVKKIAGANLGDKVLLTLTNRMVERVLLVDITDIGLEGYSTRMINGPLTTFPFANIIKVQKDVECDSVSVLSIR